MDVISEQQIGELNRRRWLVWMPLALAMLASYFHRTATGVVVDSLMQEFSISQAADIGGLSSVYFYIYALMQLPAGILADTLGPRRTIFLALITATLGAIIFALAQSITLLYVGRIISSLGVSLIYINIVKIHAEWFRTREFTTITGLLVVVGSIGFVLATTPLAFIVERLGWRIAFLMIAAYSLLVGVVAWFLVKDRPADQGLPTIAAVEAQENGATVAKVDVVKIRVRDSLKIVLKSRATWWPFFACFTIYGVYMTFMGLWGVPYFMQVYGMTRVTAASYITAMSLGTLIGAPLIGVFSDRFGMRRLPNLLVSSGFFILWLGFTLWNGGKPPVWALYPICFGIGLGMSGTNLNLASGKEATPPSMTGIAGGIINSGSFIGAALFQPLFGWVLDCNWQGVMEAGVRIYSLAAYQRAFWVCAVVLGFGVFSTIMIKETGGVNLFSVKSD